MVVKLKLQVKEIVDKKLAERGIDDAMIDLAIDEIEVTILNYCNLTTVPVGLKYTWANMAIDLLDYQLYKNNYYEGDGDSDLNIDSGAIDSVKVGDTQVSLKGGASYDARSAALKSHQPNLDEITMNYKSQLTKYRRMVW